VSIEVDGTVYGQVSCSTVRPALLGSIYARGVNYVARSIDGVAPGTALAMRELHASKESSCRGWGLWANGDLIDADKEALNNLARRVSNTADLH
jgi:hypothetical protein